MKPTVLVLEGSKLILNTLPTILKHLGYDVAVATSNDEAIALIAARGKENRFDAAIVDGCISEGSTSLRTFETLPTVTMLKEAGTPFIIASSADERICAEMLKYGCTHRALKGSDEIVHRLLLQLVPPAK